MPRLLGAEPDSAVVIYTDESVPDDRVGPDRALCFFRARALASDLGVHLIDWILCDRTRFLSLKFALIEEQSGGTSRDGGERSLIGLGMPGGACPSSKLDVGGSIVSWCDRGARTSLSNVGGVAQ